MDGSCGAAAAGRAAAGAGPGGARSLSCGASQRSYSCDGPLPRAGAQLPVDCVLLLGGVTGAAAGLRRMPRSQWLPAIGGHPHQRPPRRRVSPAPFFLDDCGGFSWVGFLSDVIGWVESALWEGCYPALTLSHGVCVIVYV